MTMKIGPLRLEPAEYCAQGAAVLGIRGSGKTYTATLLAEKMHDAGVPFVAFDPVGVWRFLRVPGAGKGYPVVVAGGEDGDLALSPSTAPAIVEAAMQNGISLVIDLFSMDLSKADWRRIVRDSVKLLLHRNKQHGLRHIFIEEAAEFVPQRVVDGDVYAMVEKLARMGGNARLGYTLINQRSEEVNKAVLELCDNLFLHRQKGRNSLLNLSKWLDVGNAAGGKEIINSLATLPAGECWAWLAGSDRPVHLKVPTKNSLHPDRNVMRGDVGAVAKKAVDVAGFVGQMRASLPAIEAQEKANDPKALRAEIAKLQAAARQAQPAADPQAEGRGYARGKIEGYADALRLAEPFIPKLRQIAAIATELAQGIEQWSHRRPEPVASPRPVASVAPPRPAPMPRAASGGTLAKAERLILTALAQYPGGRTKNQVALLAGYAVTGGGFNNALSALRGRGLMEGGGDRLKITDQGVAELGAYDPLPTGDALLQHWYAQLGKAERETLKALAGAWPNSLSKEQVAAAAGYEASGGGFNNALSRLRTLELIEGRGDLKASDDLFGGP